MRLMTMAAALLPPTSLPVQTRPHIGDTYEITSDRESSQEPRIESQIVKHVMERRRVSKPAPEWRRTA